MRRTITTLSRFITSTPSWQVNSGSFLLCLLLVVFFSCKDDAAYLGFPKDPRLNTFYVEIPVNPSLIGTDSILTVNRPSDLVQRVLVGQCYDQEFGHIVARAYANLSPPVIDPSVSVDATLDSIVLNIKMDFYNYGSRQTSDQTLQVFEVLDTLSYFKNYLSRSTIAVGTQALGQRTFSVDPVAFDNALVNNANLDTSDDSRLNLMIRLHDALGENLLNELRLNTANDENNILHDFFKFSGKYKGLSFSMSQSDKILGMNFYINTGSGPTSFDTKLSVYYTDGGVQQRADFLLAYTLSFSSGYANPATSFSTIQTDHAGTPLNGLQAFKDFKTMDGRLYVQGGTAVFTKIDLSEFYQYVDTLSNAIFQSAELLVTNTSAQKIPSGIKLRALASNNRFLNPYVDTTAVYPGTDSIYGFKTVSPHWGKMYKAFTFGSSSPTMDIHTDVYDVLPIDPDAHTIYPIYLTEFCQQMYRYRKETPRVDYFAIIPDPDKMGKSINGMILDPSTKLRLYFAKPVAKIR